MATHSAELQVPADEPAADGHFPGNPVVPGAVLLREVLHIVSQGHPAACAGIRSARFFHPVRPGDRLTVRWDDAQAASDVAFTCAEATTERRILSGMLCLRAR